MKKRIGILFGGPSGEHEVSVQSAENIRKALDRNKYEVVCIGIDHAGNWRMVESQRTLFSADGGAQPRVGPDDGVGVFATRGPGAALLRHTETADVLQEIEVFFPIVHGTFGEDGTLQGFLRLLGVPFVGAGVLGSAAGMDKDVMKRLLRDAGLPIARFSVVRTEEVGEVSFDVFARHFGTPFFVKPCNLGSSVGIHKVADAEAFSRALEDAVRYDRKILVEEAVPGRELEVSVLGNASPRASVVGEIVVKSDFYSYEAKYLDDDAADLIVPAPLSKAQTDEIRVLAVRAFQVLECRGMARVDFFMRYDGQTIVNEINTLPGFTRISMYPKLWEASGLEQSGLMDELIALAMEEHAADAALKRTYT